MSANDVKVSLTFAPKSYFWPLNVETHLRATVRGEQRRRELERYISAGLPSTTPEVFVRDVLTHDERRQLGRIHPALMGGEYLAARGASELEIARIAIRSTTGDVTAVYARQFGQRIHYRVVDEYEGATLTGRTTRSSARPLTMGVLTDFFLQAWSLLDVIAFNFPGEHIEEALEFAHASSGFYPNFGEHIQQKVSDWVEIEARARDGSE
jgi:hypothetical protein